MRSHRADGKQGTGSRAATTMVEPCDRCGRETAHEVFVHLFVESDRSENTKFSRQPYRLSVCTVCEGESVRRMAHR